jgi:hypothetical protein
MCMRQEMTPTTGRFVVGGTRIHTKDTVFLLAILGGIS